MRKIKILERLVSQYVKQNNSVSHDISHINRVRKYCKIIAKEERANIEIIEAAALIHDLSRDDSKHNHRHHRLSAVVGVNLLKKAGYDNTTRDKIIKCVNSHSRQSSILPITIEEKVLFDADKIDGLGHIGIARWFSVTGRENINIRESADLYLNELNKFYKRFGNLFTKTGSNLAKDKFIFSKNFAERILEETN